MPSKYNILCTICARGGSQGVKNKNIRLLLNRPLIAYTIQQALKWGRARHVVVSTDSQRIAEIAKRYGAEIPFIRPKILASHTSPKLFSVRHALIQSEKLFKERYDIVVDLDVSAPLRTIKDLDRCLEIFAKKKPMTLFSVVKAHKNPYFNMVEQKKDGFVKLCKKLSAKIARRQDAPPVYSMNSSIYFYSRNFLLHKKNSLPFSHRSAVYIMNDISRYDIDSEIDFKFIELLMQKGIWKDEIR